MLTNINRQQLYRNCLQGNLGKGLWMPNAGKIHSPLWKEQQWLTGCLRAKNKSGMSCACPLVVPLDAAWLSHSILLKSKRLLAFMLIVLLTLFSVSEEVIWATAEVVNLGVFRYQQKKSNLTIAYPEDQIRSSSLSMKCQISPCSCPTQFHFMKLHWHQPNRLCAP